MSLRLKMTLLVAVLLSVSLGLLSWRIYQGEKVQMYDSIINDANKTADWVMDNLLILKTPDSVVDSGGKIDYSGVMAMPEITSENAFMLYEIINILDPTGELIYSPNQRNKLAAGNILNLEFFSDADRDIRELQIVGYPILALNQKIFREGELLGYIQIIQPIQSMLDYQESLKTTLIWICVVEVVFCTIVVWLVLGFMLRRVQQAADAADSIRLKQDFSQRVPYKGANDEIGKLSRSLNLMLETLQNSYDQLKNSLVQQRQFVADVSHELRTPLTTINGNLSLLRSGKIREEEDREEILEDISDETNRLIRLVGEMLDLARADIADGNLEMEIFPLQELADACQRQMAVLDANRKVEMEIPEDLFLRSDRAKLKQLLIILLDNAYKHSEGSVKLSAHMSTDKVEIRVKDDGEGIPAELIPTIFDRFRRGNTSGRGLGLGLSIAKVLTSALHGEIRVESEPGKGACFIIDLPANLDWEAVK